MKYFTEEITTLKNGSVASAITEKKSELEARSVFHQVMATALINEDVVSVHAEAKNSDGWVYNSETWTRTSEESK